MHRAQAVYLAAEPVDVEIAELAFRRLINDDRDLRWGPCGDSSYLAFTHAGDSVFGAASEELDGLGKREPIVELEEVEDVSALFAAVAVEELAIFCDGKTRTLVGMIRERTTAHQAVPGALELRVLPDDLGNVVRFANFFDEVLGEAQS